MTGTRFRWRRTGKRRATRKAGRTPAATTTRTATPTRSRTPTAAIAAAAALAALVAPASAQACQTGNWTFGYTGGEQCYVVPGDVSSMLVTVIGGAGGTGERADGVTVGSDEGLGIAAIGTITVYGGEELFVEVGGNGAPGTAAGGGAGGWNGGGAGGLGTAQVAGGGGGGESDVRACPMAASNCLSLASRLLVGAGGGGGGGGTPLGIGGDGGSFGIGPIGHAGLDGGGGNVAGGGGSGGTSLSGPAGPNGAGCSGPAATAGTSAVGGVGGAAQTGGGGGGGGYVGGGGGGGGCAAFPPSVLGGGGGGGAGSGFGPAGTTFEQASSATPSVNFFIPPGARAPSNHFRISHLRTHADGTITFRIRVPGRGRIDALVTAWNSNLARAATRNLVKAGATRDLVNAAAAPLLLPAPGRFVFVRKHLRAAHAMTLRVRLRPNARGRQLVRRHTFPVTLRLWVTYRPSGGAPRSRGFYALTLPARGRTGPQAPPHNQP